ncbi:MAG: hypothetical protein H7Z42_17010 [Roseiflexaceae bacterium]|nr:hypothetical protein [Roseiflexaceae bacterium]
MSTDDIYDLLRRAVVELLGPRPSPARRRQLAIDLRAMADQQERLAAREIPNRSQELSATPAPKPPKVERSPGMYIRITHEPDPQTGAKRMRLAIAKQIWYDLGSPERIDVQRAGDEIWLAPTTGKTGYALTGGMSTQSCVVHWNAPLAVLTPGRYAAFLRAGVIVVGEQVA